MSSINTSIVEAHKAGGWSARASAQIRKGVSGTPYHDVHIPGTDIGIAVRNAYRNQDMRGLQNIIKSYQDGYNATASRLGADPLNLMQIKMGLEYSIPGVSKAEADAIIAIL